MDVSENRSAGAYFLDLSLRESDSLRVDEFGVILMRFAEGVPSA